MKVGCLYVCVLLSSTSLCTHTCIRRFNIDEFLNLEKIDRGVPTIIINGNLDRVRGGYYPRHVCVCVCVCVCT
jgi:hypothetical protein